MKILYSKPDNKYYIGQLVNTWKGKRFWLVHRNKWNNLRQVECESLDDIVELDQDDIITAVMNYRI